MPQYHGPRSAGWSIFKREENRPDRILCSSARADFARLDAAYYRVECGYDVYIERAEFCPAPGCQGWSNIRKVPGRGGMYRDIACAHHVGAFTCIEEG